MTQRRNPSVDPEVLLPVIGAALASSGLDVEDVQIRKAGGRMLLRVLVDRDGGLALDDAAEAARAVSQALDASAVMGEQSYVLDVGSPGVERPLTLLRHWRRNIGRLARVTGSDGGEVVARIDGASGPAGDLPPDTVVVDGRAIPFGEVRRAVVQVEFVDGSED